MTRITILLAVVAVLAQTTWIERCVAALMALEAKAWIETDDGIVLHRFILVACRILQVAGIRPARVTSQTR
jgi:hypothetical protein